MTSEWRACCPQHKFKGPWRVFTAQLVRDFISHFTEQHKWGREKALRKAKKAVKHMHNHGGSEC